MSDHNYLYYSPIMPNDVILVLGATGGDFMKETRDEIIRNNAFVINVEPTLEGILELSRYIRGYLPNNATIVSCAVSDYFGLTPMDIRDNLITSTLENRPETNERWPMRLLYKYQAPVMDMDTLYKMCGSKIDKVFCDIEGSELEVFARFEHIREIPYYAIAAYHMRNGEPTWKELQKIFEGFDIHTDGNASLRKEEVVFFAQQKVG